MKLKFYGIQDIAGQWFKSYLNNRRRKEEIKSPDTNHNTYSEWGIVNHGVPQGLVLGL
jgi:hypothetical protein